MNDAYDNAITDAEMLRRCNKPEPATFKQINYFASLIGSRDITTMVKQMPMQWLELMESLTDDIIRRTTSGVYEDRRYAKTDLGKFIDQLLKQPVKAKEPIQNGPGGMHVQALGQYNPAHANAYAKATGDVFIGLRGNHPMAELADGMYRGPGPNHHIYKVYHTVHGNNQQVAKRLIVGSAGTLTPSGANDGPITVQVKFKYEGKAPLKFLKPNMRLTLQEAMEFGALYGTCCICGRTLTNELSIHLGIGPVCGDREFGGEFTFMVDQAKLKLGMSVANPANVEEHTADISDYVPRYEG